MARDRFGQKPLMYTQTSGGFYFCSEIYPLTRVPGFNKAMNYRALDDFLSLRYIPAPHTIYQDIEKLRPGCTLTAAKDGIKLNRYWSIDPRARSSDTYQMAEKKVFALLEESVRYRMISDVPVGAFLSGGVDSSIIVGLMRMIEPEGNLQTVCMGFKEPFYDERPFAKRVADRFGTTHHEHLVTPDLVEILPKLVRHYGEPYGDSSAIPTWYLSQVTAGHVKVALSGDGGDEIFAGYNRFDSTRLVEICQKIDTRFLEGPMTIAAKVLPDMSWGEAYLSQLKHFLLGASQHPALRFILRNSVFTPQMKQMMYTEKLKTTLSGYTPAGRFLDAHRALGRISECEKLQHIDLRIFLPDDILTKIDIASMAHGLEVRSPLLDHRLAEYVLSLPFSYKHEIFRRKRVLKSVGRRFFSADFLNRKKQGFRLPIGDWFRTSLKKSLTEALRTAPIFADGGVFSPAVIAQLLAEHETGKVNHADRLWSLWFLGEWSKMS